jgi:MerR family transcriptional regulator/heat shock protein HspR
LPDGTRESVEHEADRNDNLEDDDVPLYVISVAAKLVQLPAWTLRVLDEQGIVVPKRTGKNRRLYSDSDLSKLVRVRTLTEEQGVNMNGVRIILQLEGQTRVSESDQQQ